MRSGWVVLACSMPAVWGASVLTVDPRGDDGAAGTVSAPMKTLSAAVVRGRGLPGPVTVRLADGRHELERTLELGPADSGLSVVAVEGATPVVSGGRRLMGWKPDANRPGVWQVTLDEVKSGSWYFHQLFVNGERAVRARTPNEGFFRARGPLGEASPIDLLFHPGDVKAEWAGLPDARLVMLQKWTDLHVPIRAVDVEKQVAQLPGEKRPYWMNEGDARYWVENVPDALDQAGEWYVDRGTGVLSYWAPPGLDPNVALVVAPRLVTLLKVSGDAVARQPVRGVRWAGITLAETDYDMPVDGMISPQAAVPVRGAIRVEHAVDGTLEEVRMVNLGGYALDLGRGAQGWRVVGCEIRGAGGGGVRIGEPGDREPDAFSACRDHELTDNHLHQLGRIFAPAVGVIVFQSGHNRIAHNRINDLYYTAISVGWNWGYQETPCRENVIEFNHLHDIGQGRLSDMGGVYTLGIQSGTVVRNNLIHDVRSYDYGGWGLYTDEGSTGIVMENNVVYRCKSSGFHQHYGRENHIRNNILAFNLENQLMRTRDEEHVSFYLTNNIVYFDSGNLLGSSWRNDRFVIDGNLYFDVRTEGKAEGMKFAGGTWAEWQARGHDGRSVIADPLFEDATKMDFRLKAGSPALGLGFQPIDLSRVGPRPKGSR